MHAACVPLPPPLPLQGPTSIDTPPRVHIARYVRNGLIPDASFESGLGAATNFVGACRTKELFRWACPIADIPASSGTTRPRWRFTARTGPLTGRLAVRIVMARQASGDPAFDPTATLYITNADESVTYGSATMHYGASNATGTPPDDYPSEFAWAEFSILDVPANTQIYGRFEDDNAGRLIAACVSDEAKYITSGNGYTVPSAVAAQSPILDNRREGLYGLATTLWKQNAAHLFNWTVDDQSTPQTNATGTQKNIVDLGTTGSSGFAWRLDTQNCGTRARPNAVPIVFSCYAKMSGATQTGVVRLMGVNSGFVTSVSVTGTTAQWYSATVDLDAVEDDYYVQFYNLAGVPTETLSVYAVSAFQYS